MSFSDEMPDGPTSNQAAWLIAVMVVALTICIMYALSSCSSKLNSTIGNENIEAGFNINISKNQEIE